MKGKQFPVEVYSAFPPKPGMNGADGPQPEVRDEQGRRLGRGEREAIIAADNSTGDDSSPTAAASRRVGMLVTKRPMIGREKALNQVLSDGPHVESFCMHMKAAAFIIIRHQVTHDWP